MNTSSAVRLVRRPQKQQGSDRNGGAGGTEGNRANGTKTLSMSSFSVERIILLTVEALPRPRVPNGHNINDNSNNGVFGDRRRTVSEGHQPEKRHEVGLPQSVGD